MLTFKKKYFYATILIFTIELWIALFVKDRIIRPYLGDVLVVILLYCGIRTFLKIPIFNVTAFVLIFSFTIEFLQLIKLVEILGLENARIARTVIGTSFSWVDLVAYTMGISFVLLLEYFVRKK